MAVLAACVPAVALLVCSVDDRAHAVETAAHGAHLAWCLGLATAAGDTASEESHQRRRLMGELQQAIAELALSPGLVDPAVERGKRAAKSYREAGQEGRLNDALGGCRTSLLTGAP